MDVMFYENLIIKHCNCPLMDYTSQEMGHVLERDTLVCTCYVQCTASFTIKYTCYFKSMTVIVVKHFNSVVI